MINIFISTYADSETWDYYYYFVDQPTWNNSQNCPYHKKLSCLCLTDFFLFFFKLGFTPYKAELPLRGTELQEKEAQKDYSIQRICSEKTYS